MDLLVVATTTASLRFHELGNSCVGDVLIQDG